MTLNNFDVGTYLVPKGEVVFFATFCFFVSEVLWCKSNRTSYSAVHSLLLRVRLKTQRASLEHSETAQLL